MDDQAWMNIALEEARAAAAVGDVPVGSVIVRENVIKLLFKHIFTLPDRIWTVLALRWAAGFAGFAIVNEWMRLNLSTTDWVTWHLPVLMGLMFAFLFANMPFIMKHNVDDETPSTSAAPD